MRYVDLCESYGTVGPIVVDDKLVNQVRHKLTTGTHYGDYAADMPRDNGELASSLVRILKTIGPADMTVWRTELRPRNQLKTGFGSLGVYWAYHPSSAGPLYGRENFGDLHKGKPSEFMFEAQVTFDQIDWIATLAANLVLPQEKEITLKGNSLVAVEVIYDEATGREIAVNLKLPISNVTMYDQID